MAEVTTGAAPNAAASLQKTADRTTRYLARLDAELQDLCSDADRLRLLSSEKSRLLAERRNSRPLVESGQYSGTATIGDVLLARVEERLTRYRPKRRAA
jgi:hypothetical protein